MAVTNIVYPYVFEGGEKAVASEVNADFDQVKIFANSVITEINAINQAIADLEEKPTREMFDIYFSIKGETPTGAYPLYFSTGSLPSIIETKFFAGAYPLWTGETITNCKILYPDFWNELNRLAGINAVPTVESNAAFNDIVEEYGECPCFYIDTLNGHVRLPKIIRFISSISQLSELGTVYNDQIKSHTHGLPGANSACAGGGRLLYVYGASDSPAQANYRKSSVSGSNEGYPKHVRLPLYIQVVNNTAEISRFDVDALKKELEKALADLQDAYNGYIAGLEDAFEKAKANLAEAAELYKYANVNVPVASFVQDATYDEYPYKADIVLPEIGDSLVPTVIFSLADSESGNFAPVAESGAGYVRIWAKEKPEEAVVIPTILCQ